MIDEHDARRLRCRRLGHEVAFRYCRTQEGDTVCPLVLDCWWEVFDVAGFLREHLEPEAFGTLARRGFRPKVASLLDLIEQARRSAETAPDADAPDGPRTS
ncbi:MAG: hypothetical protein GXY85_01850 [Candidatus Brocadiaceae bacterium]|nr:hypothetical protein [Candidatus Brocadiaceae bacterium]